VTAGAYSIAEVQRLVATLVASKPGGKIGYDEVVDLLAPGGIVVKDDLTPGRPIEGDATREALLLDPRLEATEILVTAEMACIVAVRRS
jgi:hypothetical protein